MKVRMMVAGLGLWALSGTLAAQSLMDAQEKQKARYGKCDSMTAQLLGSRDLDGDENDEMIQMYSFDECTGKQKAGTAVVIFHKVGGKWKAATGDTMLDADRSTSYSLEEPAAGDPKDVISLRNIFEDDAPVVTLKFTKGKVKKLK